MARNNQETKLTVTEQNIMRTTIPRLYNHDAPRICLSQIQSAETFSEETEAKRKELVGALYWDHEDYDEPKLGARPEGTDPKADVLVCGIGSCTVRVFQATEGGEIQTGECKAADYCLKERFTAVGEAATVAEGQVLYKDIIDMCDGFASSASAGNFCPQLTCGLSAGVSVDQVPGTAGRCANPKT